MEVYKAPAPDNEGLQFVEGHDLPEVVPGQPGAPTSRRGSFHSPEVYNGPFENLNSQKQAVSATEGDAPSSSYSGQPPPQYGAEKQGLSGLEAGEQKQEKLTWGMRRRAFIVVIGIVVVLVVVGVVLGAVLGTILHNGSKNDKNSSSSTANSTTGKPPPQAMANTGLAVIQPAGDPRVYSYYLDSSGAINELQFFNDPWTNQSSSAPYLTQITASDVQPSSPIAAVSYTRQSNTYRQIFYFDSNGVLTTTNTTGNNTWGQPYNTLPNANSYAGTPALAACADSSSTGGLNGIRVYYGGTGPLGNMIQETGFDFSTEQDVTYLFWNQWKNFTGSDPSSGVGCAVVDTYNHVYLRNTSTNNMMQWTWNYLGESGSTQWTQGASLPSSQNVMEAGSSIGAVTDGSNTDYIFYQSTNNQTVRVLFYSNDFQNYDTSIPALGDASIGGSMGVAYINSGSVVLNQNSSDVSDLLFSNIDRAGDVQFASLATGS